MWPTARVCVQLMNLQNDKKELLGEKQNLKETVSKLGASVARLSQEKVELEAAMEMEEEAFVNKLMRQLLQVMDKYHKMEKVRAPTPSARADACVGTC